MPFITTTSMPKLILAVVLALCGCATVAEKAAAGAGQGLRVSGTYTVADLGSTECIPLDDVRLRCTTNGLKSIYAGDLEGATTSNFEQVINCATGRTYGHGIEVFAGSLHGGPAGTLTWRLAFTSNFDCATFFPSNLRILGIVTTGSDGLASRRGVLLFDDTTYRGVVA